jgi:all-trans-retinol 13,14-reductase
MDQPRPTPSPEQPLVHSYKKQRPAGKWDAILIGSGLGSLVCGVLLARQGKKVLMLEQHYTPGGFTHVFKRKRFEWDVGIHYIGEVHDPSSGLRKLFDALSENQLEWADLGDVYDRLVFGDTHYELPKGARAFAARMKEYFPAEHQAIDRYMEAVFDASRSARSFFMEKAMPPLASAIAGGWMRRKFLRHADLTTLEVLRSLTRNEQLIGVLCGQYGDYGLPPAQSSFAMHAVLVKHYFKGAAFPVGGSSRIFDTIAPQITRRGGAIYTNASVDKIMVRGSKALGVRMADGFEIEADAVVSGAGAWNTFGPLLGDSVPEAAGWQQKVSNIGMSASHLSLYLGLDATAAALKLPRANYWVYPDGYDHDAHVSRFLQSPDAPLPLAYLSFPSAKDPDFERRYPGRSTIEIITLAPWERFAPWAETRWKHRGDDYEALKASFTDRLLEPLFRLEPQVRGHIESQELSTPLSTAHFAGYAQGEIYGLAHTPRRFREALLKPRTGVSGLWLTGQDVVSCGIGGALMGGILTASAMLGKNATGELLSGH